MGSRVSKSFRVLMPLPQSGPYEALEGIYPGRARKNWGWARIKLYDHLGIQILMAMME
jgi:hypothetical protein